uniref:Cell division cycle 20B n=1 Tax=Erpetoichthys calabaricus TaxID=27687 RepID=A0A8C4RNM3_ERPCA
ACYVHWLLYISLIQLISEPSGALYTCSLFNFLHMFDLFRNVGHRVCQYGFLLKLLLFCFFFTDLNLLDWNAQNSVAIALDASVCIWSTEHCRLMCEIHMNSNSKYASSIAWIKDGSCLAVGTSDGEVQLWDIETRKRLRNMCGHTSVVGALSWNNHILSSGSRLGFIHHYDVRMAHHHIGSLRHTKSISGLKWSPDGCRLASGSSDGILNIWPNDPNTTFRCRPLQSMVHPTAVKAMDWCPWQSEIVAVGGGMTDGVVRVWDINNGNCLRSTETKSQICSLLWLACSKEIVTGHGLPKNQIVRWDFHSLTRKAEIKGYFSRHFLSEVVEKCLGPVCFSLDGPDMIPEREYTSGENPLKSL